MHLTQQLVFHGIKASHDEWLEIEKTLQQNISEHVTFVWRLLPGSTSEPKHIWVMVSHMYLKDSLTK